MKSYLKEYEDELIHHTPCFILGNILSLRGFLIHGEQGQSKLN